MGFGNDGKLNGLGGGENLNGRFGGEKLGKLGAGGVLNGTIIFDPGKLNPPLGGVNLGAAIVPPPPEPLPPYPLPPLYPPPFEGSRKESPPALGAFAIVS